MAKSCSYQLLRYRLATEQCLVVEQQAINVSVCRQAMTLFDALLTKLPLMSNHNQMTSFGIQNFCWLSMSQPFELVKPYFWVILGSNKICRRNAFLQVFENNHYSTRYYVVIKKCFTKNGTPISNLIFVVADDAPAIMKKM